MKPFPLTGARLRRALMWLSALALAAGALPLYAIALYNHPYYDDYGFSANVHHVWQETGSLWEVLKSALSSAQNTRLTWQGTYTGTLLSNVQPGVFSESLYFIGSFFLLTSFIACFLYLLLTVFRRLGLDRTGRVTLACLVVTLLSQFMPDAAEAFYWFNGGVGNTFVYALLALSFALMLRLMDKKGAMVGLTALLALLMVALGGGSYSGGLFGLCAYALWTLWLFHKKHPRRFHMAGLWALFLLCFVYSMTAPGNGVRAGYFPDSPSAPRAIALALYYGAMHMGEFLRLPLIAITLAASPCLYRAARESRHAFSHPWLCLLLMGGLYCAQLVPPLYAGVGVGGGRIVNTYFMSFVVMWLLFAYYVLGWAARKWTLPPLRGRAHGALLLASLCLLCLGAQAARTNGEALYGVQNLNGPSAALSILTGEAARYDAEMTARESLLNDENQPVVTLSPLTAVPDVFMDDLLTPGAHYDARPALCAYYGKEAIFLAGEEGAP